ncbi:MAG: ATPase [Ruthenibacterium sp.]
MNIDELLDQMDETLEDAFNVPFSGGKRMVDIDKVRDIIDEIRLNMPTEIRQAKAIANDRAEIVSAAKKEAEAIVKRAEERARAAVSQEAVVKAAQQRANEIAVSAQTQSREMRTKVTDYCDDLLRKTEEQFTRSTAEVKTLRASLRQPKNTAKVTPKPQQNNLP